MDTHNQASQIASDWPIIAGKLPKALADAIAAWAAADAVSPPGPAITVDAITAETASDAVMSAAEASIRAEHFAAAKHRIVDDLGRRVLGEAVEAAPELLDRLQPDLTTAVEEFAQAVAELPDNHDDPAALVAGGPAAVDAYHRAISAQGKLKKFDHFVGSIPGANNPGRADLRVLRLLKPVDRAGYQGLLTAAGRRTQGQLSAVFLYAVEHGIDWHLSDPASQRAIADEINSQPVVKRNGWR